MPLPALGIRTRMLLLGVVPAVAILAAAIPLPLPFVIDTPLPTARPV